MNQTKQPETGPAEPWPVWCERPGAMDDICDAVLTGTTLSAWAQERSFSYYTVLRWVRADAGRTNQYRELADFRIDRLADEIIALGDDSSQDLCTDAKGKTAFNTAHFRRQGRQIDTRKCILRQLTTARRLAKDEKPQWSYEEELLKIGMDDEPYDPQGLLKGYKKPSQPAYDPGPPPISAATRQLGAAPSFASPRPLGGEGAQRAGEGVGPRLNTDPLKTDYSVSLSPPPLSRPPPSSQSAIAPVAASSPYAGIKIPPDALETLKRGLREYDQAKEAAAAATPHAAITALPLPHPTPNLPPAPQSALDGHLTKVPAQTGPSSETQGPVTHHASRTTSPEVPSRTTPVGQPTTNNKQQTKDQPTFPSYRAYLRAIWESGWVEGTPLPFVYRPTPTPPGPDPGQDVVGMASTPSPSAGSASASAASISGFASSPRPLGGEGAQRAGEGVSPNTHPPLAIPSASASPTTNPEPQTTNQPAKQPPKAQIGGILPKVDWYGLIGVRTLSAFLTLFILFFVTATANLHASIHSLSAPIGDRGDRPSFDPPVTLSDPHCQTWSPPRPELNSPRAINNEQRTNPSETFRRSRDAPAFPLNTEH